MAEQQQQYDPITQRDFKVLLVMKQIAPTTLTDICQHEDINLTYSVVVHSARRLREAGFAARLTEQKNVVTETGMSKIEKESELPDHLTTLLNTRRGDHYGTDADRGLFYCEKCGNRITKTDVGSELGHKRTCDHHDKAAPVIPTQNSEE